MSSRARAVARPALAALLFACLGPLSAQAGITRGPFLQDVLEEGITIAFEGQLQGSVTAGYGLQDATDDSVNCTCQPPHCACVLAGLEADTGYAYAIREGDTVLFEADFRTAPATPKPFSFAVHGDNRSDHLSHQMVVEAMMGEDYAFVLNTGDMVSDGLTEADWDEFFQIETPFISRTPLYPAVGNHEEEDGEVPIYERLFHTPAEASGSYHETYYSFNYANAHFLVIDDFVEVHPWYECLLQGKLYDNCLTKDQLAWIELDLAKAAKNPTIDHVFVAAHEGPYSSKAGRTGSAAMRDLLPLFAKSKVKLILSGHDHYFEHGISGNGIHYVISGGGGAPLYETAPSFLNQLSPHDILISKSIHNYQVITVEGPLIKVTTHNVDDLSVIEEFEIGEPPACVVTEDCEGQQEGRCEGSWACEDYVCLWVCDAPPSCETAADCGETPEGVCPGHWQCSIAKYCQWICDPNPECESDADCTDKSPLSDCEGGRFECMDEVCEWTCTPATEPEKDVTEEPDVPVTEPDVTTPQPQPDVSAPGEEIAVESDIVSEDAPAAPAGPAGPLHPLPSDKGSGCSATTAPNPMAALLLLLLLLALRRRSLPT